MVMESNKQIYNLLKNYKDKLDIIRGNSLEKLILTLKYDSDYDNLFLSEAKKLNLNLTNVKDECVYDILKTYYDTKKTLCDKNYKDKFVKISNEELRFIIEDYFKIKELNFDNVTFKTIIHPLNEELDFYIFRKEKHNVIDIKGIIKDLSSNKNILPLMSDMLKINNREEKNLIKLLLTARFYQLVSYYLEYDFNSALSENYYEIDEISYNIYDALDNINSLSQVINIFDIFNEKIIDAYVFFTNLSKKEKDSIINDIIECGKTRNIFKICPYLIFEYNSYYNLKFKSDELEIVNIGRNVLDIIENLKKQAYDGNIEFDEIYINSVEILISSYKDIDVEKTFKFIASNVYENICVKENINNEEKEYIKLIESTKNYDELFENLEFLSWLLYKFYYFNGEFFSQNILKEVINKLKEENKVYLKRLNPYYNEEEKYLK